MLLYFYITFVSKRKMQFIGRQSFAGQELSYFFLKVICGILNTLILVIIITITKIVSEIIVPLLVKGSLVFFAPQAE